MIEPALWTANITGVLERIADAQYQKMAWFNCHAEISSPDELINQLFGDYLFESFIESKEAGLSENQQSAARAFSATLKEFCDQTPQILDPREVIEDPRWMRIRRDAASLLNVLKASTAKSAPA